MSRKCAISGVGPLAGNTRSHAMNSSKRKWNPNLQKVKINGETIFLSARTLRSLRKKSIIFNSRKEKIRKEKV